MILILLVPGLISFYLVVRGRIETAFLSVYLPCLLCVPDEYRVRLPHMPPVSVAQFALIPLGLVGLYRLIRSGSYALMDLLVLLYAASIGLSELVHGPIINDGIFAAIDAFISLFLAYLAGRTLIEPDRRLITVRRFVALVLLDGPIGLWEWRMGQSPYGIFAQRVLGLGTMTEGTHIRNGLGRMGIALGGGELAGIAFSMTCCLNGWLVYLRRVKASVDLGKTFNWLEKYQLPGILLVLYASLTQSRGPLIGLAAGILILQIPRFEHTRMMTLLIAVLLICGYKAISAYVDSYAEGTYSSSLSEQKMSVMYRREMNELYPPVAEKGGWTGYGAFNIPTLDGMKSIDNHFLLVHLAWGRLGYYFFILIVAENLRVLLVRTWQLKDLHDRAFLFSMLAAMTVLWYTVTTVFLGGQLPQLSFLLIGWIQSTGRPQIKGFAFRRVFS